jgi:hypothetical protein
MTKTFTQNDLIRYIYQDNNEQEQRDLEEALLIDNDLFDAYREIAEITEELNRIDLCPSDEMINKILNYSKSLNLHSV